MKYNDFPILNNDEYKLLNEHYNSRTFERQNYINKIFLIVSECRFSQINQKNTNHKINKVIELCKHELQTMEENLLSTFSFNISPKQEFRQLELFAYINKLLSALQILHEWLRYEDKEYYKKICLNFLSTLLDLISKFISVLETLNIHLFKFM